MKKGWEYRKLGEICDFRSGFAFKSNKFTKIGEPIIRISDIQNEEIDDSNLVYFDPKSYTEDLSKYLIYPDDILIAMSGGTTGKIGINTSNRTYYLNQRVGVFRENKKYLNHRYLFYFLHTKAEESLKIAAGAAQPNLSTAQIKSFIIPVSHLSEQQRIVDYLDSAFAKIDAMKANAEKALNEAKALFQASLKEMLEPKEGWDEKALGELSDKIGDGLHGTPKYTDDGEYFFVNGNNLENGVIEIKDNTKRVNHDEYEKFKLDLNSSTVLLSINGTIGKTAFYNGEPIILGKSACYINVLPALLKEYLRYYLVSDGFFNYVKSNSRQATITNLGLKEIRRMPIPTPSLDEQQSIVATLDTLKSKVDRMQENYDKISQECDALKQAILRQVFE